MWEGNSLSTKGNCIKQNQICYTLSSQWYMRAPSILVGKMVSSLALTCVRYLSCQKCRFGLTETVWDLRLNSQQYCQSRTWRENLKSQNISFRHFSTETSFFFFFFPRALWFLNLAQLNESKRKQYPNPAFRASPLLPPSLLRQKQLADHLAPAVCSILPRTAVTCSHQCRDNTVAPCAPDGLFHHEIEAQSPPS